MHIFSNFFFWIFCCDFIYFCPVVYRAQVPNGRTGRKRAGNGYIVLDIEVCTIRTRVVYVKHIIKSLFVCTFYCRRGTSASFNAALIKKLMYCAPSACTVFSGKPYRPLGRRRRRPRGFPDCKYPSTRFREFVWCRLAKNTKTIAVHSSDTANVFFYVTVRIIPGTILQLLYKYYTTIYFPRAPSWPRAG